MSIEYQLFHPDSISNNFKKIHNPEYISKLLDVKPDEITEFAVADEFNDNIGLTGFLCRRSNHKYGSLVLTSTCGIICEQIIYCTPKLDYPFDRNGNYHFPDCKSIEFFEKLDGTNILAYHYECEGKDLVTYKSRLTPILKDQKFGMFKSMWQEYLQENPWVKQAIDLNPKYNLSFEMFGSRNPITISYDVPLEVNLLFGVRRDDHAIKPPTELSLTTDAKKPMCYTMVGDDNLSDLKDRYNKHREHMSMKNKDGLVIEGMVQYCHVGLPSWRMFKCKPEEIEKIHWTASGIIPGNSLLTTALNVFENNDNPTIQDFIELLKEEYPQDLITKSAIKIEKCWIQALERIELTKSVNEIWILAKQNGLDITKDKNETMRFISKYFPKKSMNKVGTVVLKLAGLLKVKDKK